MRERTAAGTTLIAGVLQSLLAVLCAAALLALPASASAAEPCPNEQRRVEDNSTGLPDCRAYELVSTGAQSDTDPIVYAGQTLAGGSVAIPALDGEGLLWNTPFATPGSNSGVLSTWGSARQPSGWAQTPQPLVPPGVDPSAGSAPIADVTPDLSHVLFIYGETEENFVNPGPSVEPQYVLRNPDGSYTAVASGAAVSAEIIETETSFYRYGALAELSEDGSHVFFEGLGQLAGDTHTTGNQLYEWSAEQLRVAALNSAGEELSACGAVLGEAYEAPSASTNEHGAQGHIASAVSRDGSRVFFESPDPTSSEGPHRKVAPAACQQPTDLYVRKNAHTTIDISAAPPGVTDLGEARFVGATPDGSRVFFTSPTELTPDKTDTNPDLYEYDLKTHSLTRLSVGPPGYDDANVQSAVASSDGSHVYFIAKGQLVPSEGVPGKPNLYVWEAGVVHFIATVSPSLNLDNESGAFAASPLGYAEHDAAFVTPNGDDLVWEDSGEGEIYRYDAPTETISCVSCGGPADPLLGSSASAAPSYDLNHPPVDDLHQRVISENGEMVFFTAGSPQNVYEWNDGSLSLISSGESALPSQLIGVSASGSDVFFTSFAPLVSQEAGGFNEIYDARIGGGFPAPASLPPPCGSLEACRSASTTPAAPLAPASASFSGPGNPTPPAVSPTAPVVALPKPLTRAQELSKALKGCKKNKKKSRRVACEKQARRKYGPKSK